MNMFIFSNMELIYNKVNFFSNIYIFYLKIFIIIKYVNYTDYIFLLIFSQYIINK